MALLLFYSASSKQGNAEWLPSPTVLAHATSRLDLCGSDISTVKVWRSSHTDLQFRSANHIGIPPKWSLSQKDLNTVYSKYCASQSTGAPPPPHPTHHHFCYACMSFHLTPTFWTKIFLGAMKMVFFCCAFLRQETLFTCKLLTGSPRTMQL